MGAHFSSLGQPLEGDSDNALSKQIEAQGQEAERASPGTASLLCEQSDMPHMLNVQMNWGAPWRQLKGDLSGGGLGLIQLPVTVFLATVRVKSQA